MACSGKFNKDTGQRILANNLNQPILYQEYSDMLVELAEQDERIVGLLRQCQRVSMCYMMKIMPERTF
jgi:1-deoxy-D-xylulose-5-phosphate synthase